MAKMIHVEMPESFLDTFQKWVHSRHKELEDQIVVDRSGSPRGRPSKVLEMGPTLAQLADPPPRREEGTKLCKAPSCEKKASSRGLCAKHYQQLRSYEKRQDEGLTTIGELANNGN